jgi:uncharacterized protein
MVYSHGISVQENTPDRKAAVVTSGVQVVFGTAPVHLIADPQSAVNKPIVAYTLDDVKKKLGYNSNFEQFTLNEAAYSSFELFRVAPVVFVNVLDPTVHKKAVESVTVPVKKGIATIEAEGVLLDSISVSSGDATTYEKNKDYTTAFNEAGRAVVIPTLSGALISATEITVSYTQLDPDLVTEDDLIGGYDSRTGFYTGIELISQVHPRFGVVPGQLLAPGWTNKPTIAAVVAAKAVKINGNFNAQAILDLDSEAVTRYQDVPAWKEDNNYTHGKSIALWPKVKEKAGGRILWFSSLFAARMAKTDAENGDIPYKSPSNKEIPISAPVLPDGTEIYLDQPQANTLNGAGIVTALNWNGWRTWGNNMAVYPNAANPQDQFIAVRRVLDWWGNTFILAYFDKVDDPLNTRLIESVVDSENIRANGYQAGGQIAGAKIEFRKDMNPDEEILKGRIQFNQKIGAFGPAEHIVNVLEFDPTIVTESILGGE